MTTARPDGPLKGCQATALGLGVEVRQRYLKSEGKPVKPLALRLKGPTKLLVPSSKLVHEG